MSLSPEKFEHDRKVKRLSIRVKAHLEFLQNFNIKTVLTDPLRTAFLPDLRGFRCNMSVEASRWVKILKT